MDWTDERLIWQPFIFNHKEVTMQTIQKNTIAAIHPHRLSLSLSLVNTFNQNNTNTNPLSHHQSRPTNRKKTATACAFAKQGRGMIKVNGQPIELIQPESLRLKAFEPVLILGQEKFANLDIRVRVKGGGATAQIYAIRAAIAKAIVAYHAKYVDESSKNELRKTLLNYDRNLLVSDPRRCEPKKYGGRSARSRFQKSYR